MAAYTHRGVELDEVYDLMNTHLKIRRCSLSGSGDFARALIEAGWRKVAPVDADESESTGDVKPTVDREMLKANFPNTCTAEAELGKRACPWNPHRRICGTETEHGSDRCWFHGGPSDTVTWR